MAGGLACHRSGWAIAALGASRRDNRAGKDNTIVIIETAQIAT